MSYITVHGRLTRNPELKYINIKGEQKAVVNFSVAEDKRFTEGASFYDCQAWGKIAEAIEKFFFKGKDIVVYGNHEQEPYEDKDGKTKRPWRLNVERFDFCGPKDAGSAGTSGAAPEGFVEVDPAEDDDVPF
jgi:single-strand DNA-binding protein